MYKKTTEKYTLDPHDKLVITYENGKFNVLINNSIHVHPHSLKLVTEETSILEGSGLIASRLELSTSYLDN